MVYNSSLKVNLYTVYIMDWDSMDWNRRPYR